MEYLTKEKRDYSPFFDLHFVVKVDETRTKEFSFPLYDSNKPFTEEEYIANIKAEMAYEVGLEISPAPVNTPTPLAGF